MYQYTSIPLYGFNKTFYNGESNLSKFLKHAKDKFKLTFDFEKGPWICGGAVRRFLSNVKEDADYDIFFKTEEDYNKWAEIFKDYVVNTNKFNTKILVDGYQIQLVKFPSANNKDIYAVLDEFDFTLCMVGTDGNNIFYALGDDEQGSALEHILNKRLVVNKITYANSSMRRIFKYIGQGYYMCDGAISSFLNTVTPETINEEIKYID